jgi:hypothetical protein
MQSQTSAAVPSCMWLAPWGYCHWKLEEAAKFGQKVCDLFKLGTIDEYRPQKVLREGGGENGEEKEDEEEKNRYWKCRWRNIPHPALAC